MSRLKIEQYILDFVVENEECSLDDIMDKFPTLATEFLFDSLTNLQDNGDIEVSEIVKKIRPAVKRERRIFCENDFGKVIKTFVESSIDFVDIAEQFVFDNQDSDSDQRENFVGLSFFLAISEVSKYLAQRTEWISLSEIVNWIPRHALPNDKSESVLIPLKYLEGLGLVERIEEKVRWNRNYNEEPME